MTADFDAMRESHLKHYDDDAIPRAPHPFTPSRNLNCWHTFAWDYHTFADSLLDLATQFRIRTCNIPFSEISSVNVSQLLTQEGGLNSEDAARIIDCAQAIRVGDFVHAFDVLGLPLEQFEEF